MCGWTSCLKLREAVIRERPVWVRTRPVSSEWVVGQSKVQSGKHRVSRIYLSSRRIDSSRAGYYPL